MPKRARHAPEPPPPAASLAPAQAPQPWPSKLPDPPAPEPVNKVAYLFAIIALAAITAAGVVLLNDKTIGVILISAFAPTTIAILNMMKQDQGAVAQQATHVLVNSEMAQFKAMLAQASIAGVAAGVQEDRETQKHKRGR